MRTVIAFLFLAALALPASAADAKYALTGDNTKIEWTGTKKDGKHSGSFKTVTGKAEVTDKGISIAVEIDTTSLTSDDEKLTAHLKGADFFSVKEHPKASFVTSKVAKGDKNYTVTGDLTLLGKKKEISFPADVTTTGGLTLKAEFKINRMDYGMTYGKGKVDDDVAMKVTLTAK